MVTLRLAANTIFGTAQAGDQIQFHKQNYNPLQN